MSSVRLLIVASLAALLAACGNQRPQAPPEQVSAQEPDGERASAAGAIDAPAHGAAACVAPATSRAAANTSPPQDVPGLLDTAGSTTPLKAVVVAHEGHVIAERGWRGSTPGTPTNIKSASKTIMSALVGIAIDRGVLQGTDQRVAPLLEADLPPDPDPRLHDITIGHLLSMQAGLERTSGPYYGRWVTSRNWVRDALARPFVDGPGGDMLYSTGSTHLLSAILARATGRSTLDLARDWLGPQAGFVIAAWDRDPQGIHFGGNNMAMATRSLLAFGELYRTGGLAADGRRLLSEAWIEASWQPRTRSRFTGDGYGYGWFLREMAGHPVRYAWGYGGQMLYVVPSLELTVAMTSDDSEGSARSGHRDALHGLMRDIIIAVACGPGPAGG